jgi:hypothetical protein
MLSSFAVLKPIYIQAMISLRKKSYKVNMHLWFQINDSELESSASQYQHNTPTSKEGLSLKYLVFYIYIKYAGTFNLKHLKKM